MSRSVRENKTTSEIRISQWKQFFDGLSREKLAWQTKIEAIDAEHRAQILSEGLPVGGLTFEDKSDQPLIRIVLVNGTGYLQTHSIQAPSKVYFHRADLNSACTLEIEEANGAKTLVSLNEPEITSLLIHDIKSAATVLN